MQVDLTIVGGGLVGAGLASALCSSGWRIALLDARRVEGEDPRLFALHDGSCQLLKNLGCWVSLQAFAEPIHQVHVSHHGHFGTVRLNREDVRLSALGYVIPANKIEIALNEQLKKLPDLLSLRPAILRSLQEKEDHVLLSVETEQGDLTLRSTFVIGADGADSTVRKEAHIETEKFDYQQSALVTKTTLQRAHQNIAYERFYANGAIAMLPLKDQECATIWTADNETIKQNMQLSEHEFLVSLQKAFGYRLGRLEKISQRYVFPLQMSYAKEATSPKGNVLLLGNSAHALHPIAAQGFNLALYEVAVLAEAVLAKRQAGLPFTRTDLLSVAEKIKRQKSLSMFVSHRLSQLFMQRSWAFDFAAQLGMVGMNMLPFIKKQFMNRILARADTLPRLFLAPTSDGL